MLKALIVLMMLGTALYIIWPAAVNRWEETAVIEERQAEPERSGFDRANDWQEEEGLEATAPMNAIDLGGQGNEGGWAIESGINTAEEGRETYLPTEELKELESGTGQDTVGPREGNEAVLLTVPFVAQAPLGDWSQPYQDACEEAAVIMVDRFLGGKKLTAAEMDKEILQMADWQVRKYGSYQDTNSAETSMLAQEYSSRPSRVFYDISAEDIKNNLRQGQPVIVLVDGRKLGNQFYTPPGPDKHALVITGFNKDEFITNDPGTRRGEGYRYATTKLMGAIADYDGREPGTGGKAMIVMGD